MPDHRFKVVILGSTAAGKSCFIGGLGILGSADRDSGIQVHAKENKDSKGLEYLKRLKTFLNNQEWPPPSHTTEIIDLSVFYHDKIIEITFVDYPGKDFLEELSKLDPEKNLALFNAYNNADFLLVLLDPKIDLNIGNGDSAVLKNQALERQEAVLQVIREKMFPKNNESSFKAGWNAVKNKLKERIPPNIGIVITKKDQMPQIKSSKDAENLLDTEAHQFYQNLKSIGSTLKVFAVSAVGNTEVIQVDGKPVLKPGKIINPEGYEEIFDWIISVRWWVKVLKYSVCAGLVAALLAFIFTIQTGQSEIANQIASDKNISPNDKLNQIAKLWFVWPWSSRGFTDPILDKIASDMAERVDSLPGDSEALPPLINEAGNVGRHNPRVSSTTDDIIGKAREKREDALFEKLKINYSEKDSDFIKKANDFLKEFGSTGKHSAEVEKLKITIIDEEFQKDKVYVQNFQITNAYSLIEKSIKLKEITSKWKNKISPEQAVQISRASLVAEGISNAGSTSSFTLDIVKTKGLSSPIYHYLQLYSKKNDDKEFVKFFECPQSSASVTEWLWSIKDLRIEWVMGTQIKILIRDHGYIYNRDAAENSFSDSYSILNLAGSIKMNPMNGYNLGNPQVSFILKLDGQPISETDREAFYTYFVRNTW
jgi:GTPase SAR1 family protein